MDNDFTPMQLSNRELDRLKQYKELLDFYHGRHWLRHTSRGDKQLTFNYAKTIIDKVSSYIMSGVHHIVVALEDSDKAMQKAREAESALQQVYQENNLEQLDLDTEIDCAILGDGSYKVYLQDIAVARNLPSVEMINGRKTAIVFFDEHNPKEAVVVAVYS